MSTKKIERISKQRCIAFNIVEAIRAGRIKSAGTVLSGRTVAARSVNREDRNPPNGAVTVILEEIGLDRDKSGRFLSRDIYESKDALIEYIRELDKEILQLSASSV